MIERCPCCNARFKELKQCPRCKADLSLVIASESTANEWFLKAIKYELENKVEQSIVALECSLRLKQSDLVIAFRCYILQKKYQTILDLLAQKEVLAAKSLLYHVRMLFPYSKQLQRLNMFTDYLLVKKHLQGEADK